MAATAAAQDPIESLTEETTCSFCLDYFKDPVSLACGHNFCRACLTQFWEKPCNKETCPQCMKRVLQKQLRTNQLLANFVEITKKLRCQGTKRKGESRENCGEHQVPAKLFCVGNVPPICVACNNCQEHQEHRDDRGIPLETAAEVYKDLIHISQDALQKETEKILTYKAEAEKKAQDLFNQTEEEMGKALKEITGIRQILEEQEKHLQTQMEELNKQIAGKNDENMAIFDQKLSSLKSEMEKKCQQPSAELLQDVKSLLQKGGQEKTFKKSVAFPSELNWKIWEFCDLTSFLVAAMKPFQDALLPGLELQKANVTLDPGTAGPWLILSKNHKRVSHEAKREDLPDNPKRFSNRAYVLGCEGFTTGRHFWDVFVGREPHWSVGVAKKSVRRKGNVNISSEEGIWAVGKRKDISCATNHPYSSVLSLNKKTKRVRVCLNCAANRVAFYDADTGDQIYVLSEVPFSGETVFSFFYVGRSGSLKILP
nr:PREDICTED: E3 ubiquitin-protein ligase TRIM39 [Anolis carolinensis]|eukprot:XP_008103927.1 PREDICTED: E3 ubiquitin-protein ligase TRIM39 [Anolis carolinensis]